MKRTGGLRRAILTLCIAAFGAVTAVKATAQDVTLNTPGATEELRDRLSAASATLTAKRRGVSSAQEIFAASLSDYETLVSMLYDQGYFSPVVRVRVDGREAADIPPLNPPKSIRRIEITVQPGPLFRFGTARVSPLAPQTVLPEGYRTGHPATTGLIRDAAQAGVSGWREAGYAKAKVGDQRIVANHPAARIDSTITLAPGRQLRFGTMRIAPDSQTRVREEAIRRIGGFPKGEVFDPDELAKVGARLRRTGAFASVSLQEAETANPDGTLDYTAAIADAPPRHLSFGAEIGSSDGVDLSFLWMHRNLFKGAERFRIEAQLRDLGGETNADGRLTIRLDRPAAFGADYDLFYQFDINLMDEEHYRSLRTYATVGVKRTFSDELFAELAVSAGRSRADDAFSAAAGLDYQNYYMIGLPGRVEWDKRNVKTSATSGFYLNAQVTPFAGFNDTDSGVHGLIDGRGYVSLTQSGSIVLAGRLQLGTLLGASQTGVPPELLFFSGGAGTVRGQPYESLGAMLVGPNVAGGRSLLAASIELRGQVTDKISLVGFYDVAAVDADPFVGRNSPSHAGAGLGVRYDIGGIGPIRFDLGYPVSGSTGDGLQFYIGIGQAF